MMKVLQKTVFTFAIVMGLSFAVFAQKDEQKKHPPKQTPPVITPAPTKPPPGKGDKRKRSSTEPTLATKESLGVLG